MSIHRNSSPTTITMPYLRRYCIITRREGAKAYDLYHTMMRLEWFRDQGIYRYDAVRRCLETLSGIREGRINAMDSMLFDPHFMPAGRRDPMYPIRMHPAGWFFQHGVQVPMERFDEETWDIGCLEAADAAEALVAVRNAPPEVFRGDRLELPVAEAVEVGPEPEDDVSEFPDEAVVEMILNPIEIDFDAGLMDVESVASELEGFAARLEFEIENEQAGFFEI